MSIVNGSVMAGLTEDVCRQARTVAKDRISVKVRCQRRPAACWRTGRFGLAIAIAAIRATKSKAPASSTVTR